jgi:geranyl-CoA carboxylase alpha subunit
MFAAGVPCIPGYEGADQSEARLADEAHRIGWPVMIKASAGGGGRGMRLVERAADFAEQLRSAQSEATHAFGDATVILERAIAEPRHVEVQVFADRHGHAIHLGERDCSVQRRHQKIIEEAPSPAVGPELRKRIGATAVAAAQAIGYEGAGTLEFLLDREGRFFFMEMNTRLQVEHPVTEAVTGLDLVEWQLRVAAGQPLPLRQEQIRFSGHAIEVRLCAEDPEHGFMPHSGTVALWRPDAALRVEHALADGVEVPPYYDSMIAKLVAHGADRDEARRKLARGLEDTVVLGLTTNQRFLVRCLQHPAFAAGDATTAFIGRHGAELLGRDADHDARAAALAAVLLLETAAGVQPRSAGRRLSHSLPVGVRFELDGRALSASVADAGRRHHRVTIEGRDRDSPRDDASRRPPTEGVRPSSTHEIELLDVGAHTLRFAIDGVAESAAWQRDGTKLSLLWRGTTWDAVDTTRAASARQAAGGGGDGVLRASMNGRVVAVGATVGERVDAGQPIVTLEAMKMEHLHTAPVAGTLKAVHVAVGEQVPAGRVVAEIEPAAPAAER